VILSAKHKTLVQKSFEQVIPDAEYMVEMFYGRLFDLNPSIRSLFQGHMHDQSVKFLQLLGVVVSSLDAFDALVPSVEELGRRHVAYGVKPEYYGMAKEALLWALANTLGKNFKPEVEMAWSSIYDTLAKIAIDATDSAASADPEIGEGSK
jgi:hemoglobin-like flavoprotein